MMKPKSINPFLLIGLIGLFTVGSSFLADLYRVFYGEKDIYWTHRDMKLPLEETLNDFQVFIAGKRLQNHLSEKTLYIVDTNGTQYPIVTKDINVRLNNWNKVKAAILTKAVFIGVAFGAVLTLLITGAVLTISQKKKKG
ncbi:MAG: hypothetical protein JW950_09250 [Deltaproteobacteria bacterium]|nr:hypothetical protein [Deltaproteobacteria bacterium]